ncbi:4-(cytidine 5'-diphospho)-2-C-methyl-D-erythritol kinase [Jiella sp. MQZ9-1]|uniref:4-diphosphocytidyl-2-C-methyl-D-erythritol kinase n=1 Tax=Jiella flava TaxID=2816857 RepID=A0A939G0A8_9HYPH|nr:4-(cytidine 5'-diphospho)-2-C-methyl-D-erythritol kinase [Jiella flava]MBO0664134.1 4-(cytidine 5'-diphospho)-2-C-methyl-D-erythritol kinase [Jiella flava]MCD2472706.1 4-(cytidine 5'-diphospho)-2-C-methyl-D-erythritol kinase [Jiella flava]
MEALIVPAEPRFAPAKVNLALHVVGRRPDGYHRLESLVVFDSDAGDTITARALADDESDRLTIDGRFARRVPMGGENIVLKAAALARTELKRFGLDLPPLDIGLSKHLPVAAGIGGGSADAAALLALVSSVAPPEARRAMAEACVHLGADVPMCLVGRPALVTGIGEEVTPIATMPRLSMLLVNPGRAVETPAVFRMLARPDNPPMTAAPAAGFDDVDALVAFLAESRNDLALAAGSIAPEIEAVRSRLIAAGAIFARMSGSGATVFGLFDDHKSLAEAARMIAAEEPGWWLSHPGQATQRNRP